MSKLKDHLPALVAAVVIVVLIACTCRVTYIPDPVQETTIDETGVVVVVGRALRRRAVLSGQLG